MDDIPVEQALYLRQGAEPPALMARSSGFLDEWLPEAQRLAAGFGERPPGVACPEAVFARPLGKQHVAVVQVADLNPDDSGQPRALGFRLLVVPRRAYAFLMGDPFLPAKRFPPAWHQRGELPSLNWPVE